MAQLAISTGAPMPKFAANLSFLFQDVPMLDRFDAAAKAGFKAVEILLPYTLAKADIATRLRANGLTQALFNLPAGDWDKGERGLAAIPGRERAFDEALSLALSYAEATGCRLIHAMPGLRHHGAERGTYIRNLKRAARRAAADGVSIVIEPINTRDIPGYFLNTTEEARAVIYEVAEPNLGLQFDIYHRAIQQGDVIMAIRDFGGLARHYQIANPPDRGEPDAGELNYRDIFTEIDRTGFSGWIGCEYKPRGETRAGLTWTAACGVTL